MHSTFDHLSVWEIAHRWHDIDPNLTVPEKLPLNVQDTIRLICKALIDCDISVCNANGIEKKNPLDCIDYDTFQPPLEFSTTSTHDDEDEEPTLPLEEASSEEWTRLMEEAQLLERESIPDSIKPPDFDDAYDAYHFHWCKGHWKLVDGLEQTFKNRIYNKQQLEVVHVNQPNIIKLCKTNEIDLPNFWFTSEDKQNFKTTPNENMVVKGSLTQGKIDNFWEKLNHKQKARILARETARIIWKEDPSKTIVDISKDRDLLKYGQCGMYAGKNTLRDWVKDINPNSRLGGRPKAKD